METIRFRSKLTKLKWKQAGSNWFKFNPALKKPLFSS